MTALFAPVGRRPRLWAMASLAARRARRQGPHIFDGPMLFARTRRDIAELVGLLWLAVEVSRLVRRRVRAPAL
jgi:hypothetical protein